MTLRTLISPNNLGYPVFKSVSVRSVSLLTQCITEQTLKDTFSMLWDASGFDKTADM